jgi:hypothetical protein
MTQRGTGRGRTIAALAACALAAALAGCGTTDERIGAPPRHPSGVAWEGLTEEREFRGVVSKVQGMVMEFEDQQGRLPDSLTEMSLLGYGIPSLRKGYRYWYDPRTGAVGVERK